MAHGVYEDHYHYSSLFRFYFKIQEFLRILKCHRIFTLRPLRS